MEKPIDHQSVQNNSATSQVSSPDNTEMLSPVAFLNSLTPPLRLVVTVVLLFSAARFLVDGIGLELMGRSLSQGGDFAAYYAAGGMIREHANIYDLNLSSQYDTGGSKSAGYLYPPLVAILNIPLSFLPFSIAYRLWILGQVACLLGAIYFLSKNLPSLGKWAWPLLFVLAANMYPVYLAVDIGQVNLAVLLVFALVIHLARRERDFSAGVIIAIGIMIKVVPILLIGLFILQKRWRALAGMIAGLVVLILIGLVVIGPETSLAFFTATLSGPLADQARDPSNISLAGLSAFLTQGSPTLYPLLRWGSTLAVLVVLSLISLKKVSPQSGVFQVLISLWILAIFFVSPTTWEHNLVWIVPSLAVLANVLVESGSRDRLWPYAIFGLSYTFIAFENLPLNRFGQWDFGSGWWIFSGDYLRLTLVAQIRLIGLVGFVAVALVLLLSLEPEIRHVPRNLTSWVRELVKTS